MITRKLEDDETEKIRTLYDHLMIYCALILQGEQRLFLDYLKSYSSYREYFDFLSNKYSIINGYCYFETKMISGEEMISKVEDASQEELLRQSYEFLARNYIIEDKVDIDLLIDGIVDSKGQI